MGERSEETSNVCGRNGCVYVTQLQDLSVGGRPMTIRNPEAFVRGLWDWAILDGCFGSTKILPTDIDGCIERNRQILILETKASSASTGYTTVFVIWGDTNNPEELMVFHKGIIQPKHSISLTELKRRVTNWYKWADCISRN
jgi:hypothetical protein